MPIKSPAITPGIEPLPEASFYIPATEPTTRLRRTMKRDDCFLVFDSHGDIGASPGGPDGLFNCDTRYLSHFELLINGLQPLLLGSNLSDDNCVLSVDLTNPDIYYDKRIILQKNLLHVARTVFVWRCTLFHRFAVRNFSADRVRLLLSITFDNDFADVFEVRGNRRARRGAVRCRGQHGGFRLSRSRRQEATHTYRVRADADTFVAVAGFVPDRPRAAQVGFALWHDRVRW
jgi:glycogen debranching enzyme